MKPGGKQLRAVGEAQLHQALKLGFLYHILPHLEGGLISAVQDPSTASNVPEASLVAEWRKEGAGQVTSLNTLRLYTVFCLYLSGHNLAIRKSGKYSFYSGQSHA